MDLKFLKKFSMTVAFNIVSFRCIAPWLDIYTTYKMIPFSSDCGHIGELQVGWARVDFMSDCVLVLPMY